eukprot:TRINITY_DN5721_c0_g1_i4.p1 TRINITY_DN5721_c0_g1~~TRINITY_DN5721_c0_g1_i4.p1  ORF type:complete len:189 (+),score=1.08 TRINITY_DN5721_c0_g1_i4:23-568(+)
MIRRPPRSTHCISSAASDVYKRQIKYRIYGSLIFIEIVRLTSRGSLVAHVCNAWVSCLCLKKIDGGLLHSSIILTSSFCGVSFLRTSKFLVSSFLGSGICTVFEPCDLAFCFVLLYSEFAWYFFSLYSGCVRRCRESLPVWLKRSWQPDTPQTYGFSLVCVLVCSFRYCYSANFFPQYRHE